MVPTKPNRRRYYYRRDPATLARDMVADYGYPEAISRAQGHAAECQARWEAGGTLEGWGYWMQVSELLKENAAETEERLRRG